MMLYATELRLTPEGRAMITAGMLSSLAVVPALGATRVVERLEGELSLHPTFTPSSTSTKAGLGFTPGLAVTWSGI